jgi:hypothetical protein
MAARSVAGVLVAATVVGLALTGCTSAERPANTIEPNTYAGPPIGSSAPSESSAPSASASPSAAPAATGTAGSTGKVSASNAVKADIVRALTTAGVPTPDRWADEVVQYRPYPANDPTLAKLRQNLAKENPPPGVVDKIVSALTP